MENDKSAEKKPVKAAEEKAIGKTTAKRTAKAVTDEVQEEKKSTAVKKTPVKKTAAPRKTTTSKAEPEVTMFIEYEGKQVAAGDITEAVKKDFLSKHKDTVVKTIEVYVKPEEHTAYYAVNGEGSDQDKIIL